MVVAFYPQTVFLESARAGFSDKRDQVFRLLVGIFENIFNSDTTKILDNGFSEKNLDLITFDMIHAEKMIPKAKKALNPGGWIFIYGA